MDPLVIVFGLGVGILIGMTGIGGGSLMTPLLILFAGIHPTVAIGTDLAYGAVTKTLGGWQHLRKGTVDLGEQFKAKQLNYGGSLVFQYPLENGFTPYGAAGFGRQSSDPTTPIAGVESVNGFDFMLGGGIKYFFNGLEMPWLGFRFDFRYHFLTSGLAFEGNEVSPRQNEFTFGGVLRPF